MNVDVNYMLTSKVLPIIGQSSIHMTGFEILLESHPIHYQI